MTHAIELLQNALRHELQSKAEAEQYLDGNHGIQTAYAQATIKAFKESQRLAIERIPQLDQAINILSTVNLSAT